jgi:hypothetical protein
LKGIQNREFAENRERDCLDISASDKPREEKMERIVDNTTFEDWLERAGIVRLVQAEEESARGRN